jgi:hypothetical protein
MPAAGQVQPMQLSPAGHASAGAGGSAHTACASSADQADLDGGCETARAPTPPTVPMSAASDPPPTAAATASGAGAPTKRGQPDAGQPDAATPTTGEAPPFFATVSIDEGATVAKLGNGDLWPSCWSNDDALYVAAGDGTGFGLLSNDVVTGRIDGRLGGAALQGTALAASASVSSVWSGSNYNRKPTGMLCLDGDLYLAVQDLRVNTFEDAPAATIVRSHDKGVSWSWDHTQPMFSNWAFTTIMFLDFGKDSEHAPKDYVYAYGMDDNWSFDTTRSSPTQLFLARVPRDQVQQRARWQFFSGLDAAGEPSWNDDIAARMPVLEDTRRLYSMPLDSSLRFKNMTTINQGGVVYNAPLNRYIYSSWTEYTFELYEAPTPWGPFRLFQSQDFGTIPWTDTKNGGYGTTIPSKFISDDGLTMWLQANAWSDTGKDSYGFSLRAVHMTPFAPSEPDNQSGPTNLATQQAVPLTRALRNGHVEFLANGVTSGESEDSWNGETKTEDYWGYTWSHALRINTLRYTSGPQSPQGGAFSQLTVQVRQGGIWLDANGWTSTPEYPLDGTAAAFTTYTFRFDTAVTDGVRLHGQPGGSEYFTSIAELSAHYE